MNRNILTTGIVTFSCTVLMTTGLAAPAQAATAPSVTTGGSSWLAGQLSAVKQPGRQGLLSDFILGITATKQAQSAAGSATDYLETVAAGYAQPGGAGTWSAGATAKLLLVSVAQQRDPATFGGIDLRNGLISTMTTSGAEKGRFRDVNSSFVDYSNGFSQTLAILGLSRSGGVSADAVSYLIGQQCPNGGFPVIFDAAGCNDNVFVDHSATAMAVQTLLAPGVTSPAATDAAHDAASYLLSIQQPDGSFDAPPWEGPNGNTTGLAAAALRQAGHLAAANRSSDWLIGQQLNCAVGVGTAAHGQLGAIAYSAESFGNALAAGISDGDLWQWHSATSQAILGMPGASSYATVSSAGAVADTTVFDCAPPAPAAATIRFATDGKIRISVAQPAGHAAAAAATELHYQLRPGTGSDWGPRYPLSTTASEVVLAKNQQRGDVARPAAQKVAGRHVAVRASNAWGSTKTELRLGVRNRKLSGNASCRTPAITSIQYLADTRARITLKRKALSCVKVRWRINGKQLTGWQRITAAGKRTVVTPPLGATGYGTLQVRGGASLLSAKLWSPR